MNQHSGLTLAYLGDSYYELEVRKHLLERHLTNVNDLHKKAILYTSAVGQEKVIKSMLDQFLSEEEIAIYKRGRNATSNHKPKNAELSTYRHSTGFECLLGFLLLEGNDARLKEIVEKSFEIIEELNESN